MKTRLLLLTLALVCVFATSARQLSPDEALARAKSHAVGRKVPAANVVSPKLVRVVGNEKCQSAAYLFTDGTSTLIVSGDDRITPVLGYTDAPVSGKDAPEAFECWLKSMADEVAYAISENLLESPVPSVGDPIEPLLKSTWGQTGYYNRFSPVVGGKQSPTGCVATALAQIMYHHQWPAKPVGTASCRTTEGNTYSMDFDGIEFDWSNMTDSYNEQSSESSIEAVSTLMKCVGYGVNMNYGPYESGATTSDALKGMLENFNYSSETSYMRREAFTRQEWEKMLYTMLSGGMPVFHTGRDAVWFGSGGHAFVCDGYDGNGYFHFNWGWDGSYDGYFLTSCLVPAGAGTGGYINGYNYSQEVLVNLHPNDGKQYNNYDFVQGISFSYDNANSIITASCNRPSSAESYEIGVRFSPIGGTQTTTVQLVSASGETDFSCTLDGSTTSGLDTSIDYEVRFVWRPSIDIPWSRILSPVDGFLLYAGQIFGGIMTYNGEKWILNPEVIDRDSFDVTVNSINFNKDFYFINDQKNTLEISLKNNQDDYFYHAIRLYFVNVETGEKPKFINLSLELLPNESTTKRFNLNIISDIPEGEYYIELTEANTGQSFSFDQTQKYNVYGKNSVKDIDDGTFVYSLIPNGQCKLKATLTGLPASGDVRIPAYIRYENVEYPVTDISMSLNNILSSSATTSLIIEFPLEELPDYELYNFSVLENLELPESLRSIGQSSVAYCRKLKTINMPTSLDYIGENAFYSCNELEAVNIPSVETLSSYAFYDCQKLKQISIPEGVVNIGKSAFDYCDSATSIELPSTLSSVGERAFHTYSNNHENIYCSAQTYPSIESNTFYNNDFNNATLHVPAGTKDHYASDTNGWGKFFKIEESGTTGVESIFGEADDIPEQWFTISGIRLKERPTIPGCYIKVQGDDRQTMVIK